MIIFSIITAFYKGNQYLEDLYETVSKNAEYLMHSGIDAVVEIILVNDSPNYILKLPEKPGNINVKVVTHETNYGIHQARVTGLNNCSGQYVVFLDQDDLLSDDALYREYQVIGNCDVVIGNAYIEQENGEKELLYKHKGQYKNAMVIGPYIKSHNQIISPGHCFIRKDAIPNEWYTHILKANGSDDLFLWILMFSLNRKFIMLDSVVYIHRYTGENLSALESKMAESSLELKESFRVIEYVDKKMMDAFIRNREQKLQMAKSSKIKRIMIIVKNFDIYFPRVFWRIRGLLFS